MIFSLTEADRGLNKQYIKEVICYALKIREGFRKEMRLHLRAKTSRADKRGKILKRRTGEKPRPREETAQHLAGLVNSSRLR